MVSFYAGGVERDVQGKHGKENKCPSFTKKKSIASLVPVLRCIKRLVNFGHHPKLEHEQIVL
jgi:hypothetical protein